jgi:3-deoxy-D-manno-octulosonic-acid transferase
MLAEVAGVQVATKEELVEQLRRWLNNREMRDSIGEKAANLVKEHAGASAKVLKTIGEFWTSKKR